jgi:hypothetical protein
MSNKIKKVIVFGLGAAGANFLYNIVHSHPDLSYTGVDFDKVEPRNYDAGTQPYSKIDLNRPKVQAMQRIIQTARNKKITGNVAKIVNIQQIIAIVGDHKEAIVVDAFDNAESRNLFLEFGKDKWNILHVGFSPTLTGEAVWQEAYSKMTPDKKGDFDVCQMHTARSFIQALTAMASLVVTEFIDSGNKRNVYFDSKLKLFTF